VTCLKSAPLTAAPNFIHKYSFSYIPESGKKNWECESSQEEQKITKFRFYHLFLDLNMYTERIMTVDVGTQ
jgi:hypothetical protein